MVDEDPDVWTGPLSHLQPTAAGFDRETLLQRLIDCVPALLGYWDSKGCNVVASSAFKEWFGLDPASLRGMHVCDILGEELYEKHLPFIQGVMAGKEQLFETTLSDGGGAARPAQVSYVPDVVDEVVVGYAVLVTDLTERAKAERGAARNLAHLHAAARNLPHSFIMLFDEDLRYLIADGQVLEDFGLSRDVTEGRTLDEVLPDRAAELEPRYKGLWTVSRLNGRARQGGVCTPSPPLR